MTTHNMRLRTTPVLLGGALALAALPGHATNGYFSHGFGTQSKGMGGTAMAIGHDGFSAATNPANLAGMTTRGDASLALFRPERSYRAEMPQGAPNPMQGDFPLNTNGQSIDSDRELFAIPGLAYVQQIDQRSSWGLTLVGNGGLNTSYAPFNNNAGCPPPGGSGPFCAGKAGVDLMQLAIIPTYAIKLGADQRFSLGVSPIINVQRFSSRGLEPFGQASSDPTKLSGNGNDTVFGFGAQVGVKYQIDEQLAIGASYRSEVNNEEFDDYAGLFADGGDFDVPSTYGLGIEVRVNPQVRLAAEWQRINYSDVEAINNSITNLTVGGNPLGSPNGPGFGWDDMDVFKIGGEFETGDGWTWRLGVNYGEQPVESSEVLFNILAPAVVETHYTFGFTKNLTSNGDLHFAAMYAPNVSVRGTNGFINPNNGSQVLEIEMRQYELEIGYSHRF